MSADCLDTDQHVASDSSRIIRNAAHARTVRQVPGPSVFGFSLYTDRRVASIFSTNGDRSVSSVDAAFTDNVRPFSCSPLTLTQARAKPALGRLLQELRCATLLLQSNCRVFNSHAVAAT